MFSSGESRTLVLVPYLSALRLTWRKDDSSSGSPSDEDEDDSRRHTFHRGSSDRVFEYYNRGPPYRRIPLAQHAREMQRDYPEIWNFPLDNLDPDNSWFAVSWHPVVVSGHDHVTGIFRGHFVMYHALRRNQIPWPAAKNRLKQDESRWLDTKQEGRGYVEMIGFVGFETTLDTWYTNGGGEQKKLGKAPGMLESYAAVVNHLNSKKVGHPDFDHMLQSSFSFAEMVHIAFHQQHMKYEQRHRKHPVHEKDDMRIRQRRHQHHAAFYPPYTYVYRQKHSQRRYRNGTNHKSERGKWTAGFAREAANKIRHSKLPIASYSASPARPETPRRQSRMSHLLAPRSNSLPSDQPNSQTNSPTSLTTSDSGCDEEMAGKLAMELHELKLPQRA
uniref:Uncharacterized protein n=1 Tax=Lotharella globosa TaxID=91324 RepID=A0A7S3YG63_9EUKA